jgi:hypothetical protein
LELSSGRFLLAAAQRGWRQGPEWQDWEAGLIMDFVWKRQELKMRPGSLA